MTRAGSASGLPTVKQLRKAASRSSHVAVMTYGEDRIKAWWESCRGDLEKIGKLSIYSVTDAEFEALAALARRHMRIAVTVQDRVVWVADAQGSNIEIHPAVMKEATE